MVAHSHSELDRQRSQQTSCCSINPLSLALGLDWGATGGLAEAVGSRTQAVQGRRSMELSVGERQGFVGSSPGILTPSTPGGLGMGWQEGRKPTARPRCLPFPLLCPGSCILQPPLWPPYTPACPTWMPCTVPGYWFPAWHCQPLCSASSACSPCPLLSEILPLQCKPLSSLCSPGTPRRCSPEG